MGKWSLRRYRRAKMDNETRAAAGVLRPAPPDTPAKIAADMRLTVWRDNVFRNAWESIAARVEALGEAPYETERELAREIDRLRLQPSEREVVRQVRDEMRGIVGANPRKHPACAEYIADDTDLTDWIAALTPIAEAKP